MVPNDKQTEYQRYRLVSSVNCLPICDEASVSIMFWWHQIDVIVKYCYRLDIPAV